MKSILIILYFFFASLLYSSQIYAWGPEGHAIVGRIALNHLNDDVRKNVLQILGNMSIDTAANWMDIMKSNSDYDFMRAWHYLDFPKGKNYQSSNQENILNRLIITYSELQHKQTLCDDQIKTDLLILLHLMGDLHMPLHTGYDDDLGGNKLIVQYDTIKTHNLHRFWDEDIIALTKINENDCMRYKEQISFPTEVTFESWMQDTRLLLPGVYNYSGFMLSSEYLSKNKTVVEKQLLIAGMRLALILNKLFYSPAPNVNYDEVGSRYKNYIKAGDAVNNIGKIVTVCEKVYSIRYTGTITQINLGGKFPNAPLTIVIFGRNYVNFKGSIEQIFKDKNICVKGKVEEYKGKAQIVVEDEKNLIFID